MNVPLAGAMLAIGIALYIAGLRGVRGPRATGPGSRPSPGRATTAAWAAFGCAVAASLRFAVVPVHVTETSSDAGGVVRTQETLVVSEGYGVLPVLVAPVAITLLAVVARRPAFRIALAAIFDAACFLALLSIGAFYIPAAIALTIAAAITPRPISEGVPS